MPREIIDQQPFAKSCLADVNAAQLEAAEDLIKQESAGDNLIRPAGVELVHLRAMFCVRFEQILEQFVEGSALNNGRLGVAVAFALVVRTAEQRDVLQCAAGADSADDVEF